VDAKNTLRVVDYGDVPLGPRNWKTKGHYIVNEQVITPPRVVKRKIIIALQKNNLQIA